MVLTWRVVEDSDVSRWFQLHEIGGAECRDDRDYLWAYIRQLRRNLEPDPEHPMHIRSEPGFGYVLDYLPE